MLDYLKSRSNKNVLDCKKYGCRYFYMPNYQSFLSVVLLILQCIKNGSIVKN